MGGWAGGGGGGHRDHPDSRELWKRLSHMPSIATADLDLADEHRPSIHPPPPTDNPNPCIRENSFRNSLYHPHLGLLISDPIDSANRLSSSSSPPLQFDISILVPDIPHHAPSQACRRPAFALAEALCIPIAGPPQVPLSVIHISQNTHNQNSPTQHGIAAQIRLSPVLGSLLGEV